MHCARCNSRLIFLVNNSTMNCPPPAVESTLPDHELRKGSQEVFTSTKKLLPTAKVTDCDSSDDSFYISKVYYY